MLERNYPLNPCGGKAAKWFLFILPVTASAVAGGEKAQGNNSQGKMKMELKIIYLDPAELKPYEKNTRKHADKDIKNIIDSIKKYGFNDPIGIYGDDNLIVEGHGRQIAALKLKMSKVPCVRLDHMTDEQRREYAIAHNATAELSEWDFDMLADELADLDMGEFDFDFNEGQNISDKYTDKTPGALKEKFIMPPFSVLDARQGDWQKRKKAWLKIIDGGAGRNDDLIGGGLKQLALATNRQLTGTSIFDPVLCEVLINWFSPKGGKIIDPFSGGSTRGIISQFLDRDYYGNDLREEQITENKRQFETLSSKENFFGGG